MQAPCLFFVTVLRYPVGKVYLVIDVLYPELQYEAVCEHTSGVYRGRHTARVRWRFTLGGWALGGGGCAGVGVGVWCVVGGARAWLHRWG